MKMVKCAALAAFMVAAGSIQSLAADKVTFSSAGSLYSASTELVGVSKYVEALDGLFRNHPEFAGKIQFDIFDKGRLFNSLGDHLEAVSSGAIQITYSTAQEMESLEPAFKVVNVPGTFADFGHFKRTMQSEPWQKVQENLAGKGVTVIAWVFDPGELYFFTQRPINSVEDFAGLKIRYPTGDAWRLAIEGLGARPIPIPYTEVVTALQTNLLDGLITNFGGGVPYYSLQDYAKHATLITLSIQPDAIVANTAWWESLSDAQRAAVKQLFDIFDAAPYFRNVNSTLIDAWTSQEGLVATVPDDADVWRQKMADATAQLMSDLDPPLLQAIEDAKAAE